MNRPRPFINHYALHNIFKLLLHYCNFSFSFFKGHGDETKKVDQNNKDSTTSPPAGQQQRQPVKRIHQIVVPPTHPQIRENNKKMMLGNGDSERAGKLDVPLSQQDKEKEGLDSKHGEAAAVVGGHQNQDESDKAGGNDIKNNNQPRRQVDVKKVTLEDDEFGDQNLDNKAANAGNGGGNNNEDDDDHQGVEGGPDEGIEVP